MEENNFWIHLIHLEVFINFINENYYEFDKIIFNIFKDLDRDI